MPSKYDAIDQSISSTLQTFLPYLSPVSEHQVASHSFASPVAVAVVVVVAVFIRLALQTHTNTHTNTIALQIGLACSSGLN